MRVTLRIIVIVLWSLFGADAYASHISGGSIKYAYVGPGQYYLEAQVFRDCGGASFSSTSVTLSAICSATLVTQNIVAANVPFVAPTPITFGGPYAGILISGTVVA